MQIDTRSRGIAIGILVIIVWIYVRTHFHRTGIAGAAGRDAGPFADFVGIRECGISMDSIFAETNEFCTDKDAMLDSCGGGGRPGMGKAYRCLDCSMKWFSSAELCEIWTKYRRIVFVGDFTMRNLYQTTMVYARRNFLTGGLRQWTFKENEDVSQCYCDRMLGAIDKGCALRHGVYKDIEIKNRDSRSWFCPNAKFSYVPSYIAYPNDEITLSFNQILTNPQDDSDKPIAVILEHGIYSNLKQPIAKLWIEHFLTLLRRAEQGRPNPHVLWLPPDNFDEKKDTVYWGDQGHLANAAFQIEMRDIAHDLGIDVINTWNLTVQTNAFKDGTYHGFEVNLVKAMFLWNWLALSI